MLAHILRSVMSEPNVCEVEWVIKKIIKFFFQLLSFICIQKGLIWGQKQVQKIDLCRQKLKE